MGAIANPVLRGFNPDPSILRVGDDYYIATSTFEWYPGVQIHHSRDLARWELIARPLNRAAQLDMRGNPDSCGVWAPCLSYADGLFWLAYTDVKRHEESYKDTHNYLVVAPAIDGPWSDPVYLNSSGFDPSLFHDDDGRKWLVNLRWDNRTDRNAFGGIVLQEYVPDARALAGDPVRIFAGSELGFTEGPHLYKRDGWYYLLTAEGGTAYCHAITMARSRTLTGPYELHPETHVVTSKDAPEAPLQRAGHGDFVETPEGDTYIVSLVSRPLPGTRRSPLGRETMMERAIWGDDGWLRLEHGSPVPRMVVPSKSGARTVADHGREPIDYKFDSPQLPLDFQWLRTPAPERLFSLSERPGRLRLFGREAIGSWFEQALVARRATDHAYEVSTTLSFDPVSFQQCAGLVVYYNRHKFHYLHITRDEALGRVVAVQSCVGDWPEARLSYPAAATGLDAGTRVTLRARVDGADLEFAYAVDDAAEKAIGPVLDASVCSDEGGRGEHASFTGTFAGMACHDVSGRGLHADFFAFSYRPL